MLLIDKTALASWPAALFLIRFRLIDLLSLAGGICIFVWLYLAPCGAQVRLRLRQLELVKITAKRTSFFFELVPAAPPSPKLDMQSSAKEIEIVTRSNDLLNAQKEHQICLAGRLSSYADDYSTSHSH